MVDSKIVSGDQRDAARFKEPWNDAPFFVPAVQMAVTRTVNPLSCDMKLPD